MHTEAWWVRYAPQAWLIPPLVFFAVADRRERVFRWGRRAIAVAVTAYLLLACVGFAIAQRRHRQHTITTFEEMSALVGPIHVYLHAFRAFRRRLDEAGIRYIEIPPPSYSTGKADLEARNFMPPAPWWPADVRHKALPPHIWVLWY